MPWCRNVLQRTGQVIPHVQQLRPCDGFFARIIPLFSTLLGLFDYNFPRCSSIMSSYNPSYFSNSTTKDTCLIGNEYRDQKQSDYLSVPPDCSQNRSRPPLHVQEPRIIGPPDSFLCKYWLTSLVIYTDRYPRNQIEARPSPHEA